jgi:hypothetical protein
VQLPATRTEAAETYWIQGVEGALRDMEAHRGVTFDPDGARAFDEAHGGAARTLAPLLRSCAVPALAGQRLGRLLAWTRPDRFLAFLEDNLGDLPALEPRTRVVVTGSVSCEEDDPVFEILDHRGACAVPLTCTGLHGLEGLDSLQDAADDDLVAALARRAFRSPACMRSRPNTDVYERIQRTVEETGAAGVILKTLPFCDLWYTEKVRLGRSLKVPVLVLETGYGEGARGRTLVRLEAFLETLA